MNSAHPSGRRLAPHTTSNDERRLRLVESAYSLIAEKGMAGLRIREVASRIGLNHATLLYYFPTKEALIQAVVEYCIRQFDLIQAPNPSVATTPSEHLRQRYLSDLAHQLREVPDLFLVLDEFLLYARRDPATHSILMEAVTSWQHFLERLIQEEMASGRFRADIDARSAALTLMAFCQGVGLLLHTRPEDIDGILSQLSTWFHSLLSPHDEEKR
ncbi:TetR/AcrR family transcriptional regulator [Tengunoibacter tsumagoiensis]|uniref:TetR family transcriptional regulator n=1 Tax=Tengunoibacter tsumagoiensis TaxID=2014871 RepID=A0A402A192_9CHLR|nr:TetR/AcrR family transcriptional regulator [Tengunoibacter tsumagoiensis]GCE12930.1 TetR family transcriptional regulator [Tengunoibacter tsumagoiensis]